MKAFFTTFIAALLGVIAAFALFLFIMIGSAIASMSNSDSGIKNGSVLHLILENNIPELTNNVAQQPVFTGGGAMNLGLERIIQLIETAATDDKIKGIILQTRSVSVGQATLLSLHEALKEFKESGKFIYSYADSYSQSAYMLSSVADSIYVHPYGGIDLKGFGATIPFFKNMLDKVGIKMEIFYAGNFKSATEPFRTTEISEYNKLQTREFLNDMKNILVNTIAENRKMPVDSVEHIISTYSGRTGKKALANHLVDNVMYIDQFEEMVRKKLELANEEDIPYVDIEKYHENNKSLPSFNNNKIAVVYAEGEIVYESEEYGSTSEALLVSELTNIRNDQNIKAVVLRVNSPGGNAFTSEIIWREIEKIKESGKPVIASYGDYAASGGYYISCGADKIFAQPNTLTGSIGVFIMFPNVTTLLNDKLGINFDTVKTHQYAAGLSPFLDLTESEKALLQESTIDIYDLFLERVATGRNLPLDSAKIIAQGRVYTGKRAIEIGLVDQLGDLDDAIEFAAKTANLESYKLVNYPEIKEDFLTTLLREVQKSEKAQSLLPKSKLSKSEEQLYSFVKTFGHVVSVKEPQVRLPWIFNFQ